MKYVVVFALLIIASGCSHAQNEDPYRTVPVTNNPNMIHGGVGPRMTPF